MEMIANDYRKLNCEFARAFVHMNPFNFCKSNEGPSQLFHPTSFMQCELEFSNSSTESIGYQLLQIGIGHLVYFDFCFLSTAIRNLFFFHFYSFAVISCSAISFALYFSPLHDLECKNV